MGVCRTDAERNQQERREDSAETVRRANLIASSTGIAIAILAAVVGGLLWHKHRTEWDWPADWIAKRTSWFFLALVLLVTTQAIAAITALSSSTLVSVRYSEPSGQMLAIAALAVIAWFIGIGYTMDAFEHKDPLKSWDGPDSFTGAASTYWAVARKAMLDHYSTQDMGVAKSRYFRDQAPRAVRGCGILLSLALTTAIMAFRERNTVEAETCNPASSE